MDLQILLESSRLAFRRTEQKCSKDMVMQPPPYVPASTPQPHSDSEGPKRPRFLIAGTMHPPSPRHVLLKRSQGLKAKLRFPSMKTMQPRLFVLILNLRIGRSL